MLLDSFETREKILQEFLKICPFDGWSKEALLKAVSAAGIEEKFCDLIFENGLLDLAEFYIEYQNNKAAEITSQIPHFYNEKIRLKIRQALYARFEVEKNNQIALQRLINFYINPKNFASFEIGARPMINGLKSCYSVADSIWKSIHDQSTDFNFYTKRLTLSKIILRSLLVFVKDESHDFIKTKNFIDAQIEKVMKFEKRKHQVTKAVKHVFVNEEGEIKTPQEFVKDLPFIRLIKFK
ncbi:MAG: COQ9 family protein [Pseudomonadota bacterium]